MRYLANQMLAVFPSWAACEITRIKLSQQPVLVHPNKWVLILADCRQAVVANQLGQAEMRMVPIPIILLVGLPIISVTRTLKR